MTTKDLLYYRGHLQTELYNILSFWAQDAINPKTKQFYGKISGDGTPNPTAHKGIIMYSRILWTFSAAARFYKDERYLVTANKAKSFIEKHFYDKKHGGYFWEVSHDGTPLIRKKQVYAQAFVMYAYAEYYLATKQDRALSKAMDIFYLLETHCYDVQHGGYFEAFSESWKKLDDVRLSDKDMNLPKGMNTNLHVLEAYSCLFEASKNPHVKKALAGLIDIFNEKIIDANGHVIIFFSEDWQPKTYEISYGHDIETSWLLWDAAELVNNPEQLTKIRTRVLQMVEVFLAEGYDAEAHAVYYELHTTTNKRDADRHWWVQVEAMEGLANAYAMTKHEPYLETVFDIWKYTSSHLIDRTNGEWFWRVSQSNQPYPADPKISMWKCPYHNSRALMRVISKINTLLA